jgi:hypothetical protein
MAAAGSLAPVSAACRPSLSAFGDALVVVGRQFRHRNVELVARYGRGRKLGDILLHRVRLPCGGRDGDIAGGDGPGGGLLRRRRPLDEGESSIALLGRGVLEDVEVAAAGGRAAAHLGWQLGDAEGEGRVGAYIGEVAGRRPHHGDLALEEILRRGAPLDDAFRVHLVLPRQVDPEPQRLDDARVVIGHLGAGLVGEDDVVLRRQRLEQPVGEARRRDLNAPADDVAGCIALGEPLGECDHLVPGRRRHLRIEAHLPEGILVPVLHDGGALEGDAPGLAAGAAVEHEALVEAVEPGLVGVRHQLLEGHDGVLVDQREHVRREDDGELRRIAALERGDDLGDRVLVAAGIDGIDLDVRVRGREIGHHLVDDLGDRAADGDGIVHVDRRLGRDRRDGERERRRKRGCRAANLREELHASPPCSGRLQPLPFASTRRPLAASKK